MELAAKALAELERNKEARHKAWERLGLDAAEDRAKAIDHEAFIIEERIGATQARTVAGLLVQARILAGRVQEGDVASDTDAALAVNMLASIERMAEEAAS